MNAKTYRVRTMQEALELIRRELGPQAAVLHAREIRSGLFRTRRLEVTAATGVDVPSRFEGEEEAEEAASDPSETPAIGKSPASTPIASPNPANLETPFAAPASPTPVRGAGLMGPPKPVPATDANTRRPSPPRAELHDFAGQFRHDLRQHEDDSAIPSLLEELCRHHDETPNRSEFTQRSVASNGSGIRPVNRIADRPKFRSRAIEEFYPTLIGAGWSDRLAGEILHRMAERIAATQMVADPDELPPRRLREILLQTIEGALPTGSEIGMNRPEPTKTASSVAMPTIAALIGPTGVGKTTTLAKLAAEFGVRRRRRVALVTVDTYRIAAIDQLRTYAEIMSLPLEVVATPREMRESLERLRSYDLILLDAPGVSPRDAARLQELRSLTGAADSFLRDCRPNDTIREAARVQHYLVLSAAAGPGALEEALVRFRAFDPVSLILTKLDEVAGLGHAAGVLLEGGLGVAYVTDGQNVPEDFALAEAPALARSLLAASSP